MWKAKAYQVLPLIVEKYSKARWVFLTLTVRNCPITELNKTLSEMTKAWERFSKLKAFPALGWIRSTEVTRCSDNTAHPHFHCILMVPSSYFGKNYLSQIDWTELWKKSLRIDYQPMVNVQAVKASEKPETLIPEILKYTVKESDLIDNEDWFLELTRQMHRVRTIATGGVLKEYLKALESELENLITESEEESDQVDEGHLYFGWKKKDKKYKLVD
jgi:plasmid rolling circle replication initiator protein Rep